MAADLSFPVEIVGGPIIRHADGVALSSRNTFLSAGDRIAAAGLYRGLMAAADAVDAGERHGRALEAMVRAELIGKPGVARRLRRARLRRPGGAAGRARPARLPGRRRPGGFGAPDRQHPLRPGRRGPTASSPTGASCSRRRRCSRRWADAAGRRRGQQPDRARAVRRGPIGGAPPVHHRPQPNRRRVADAVPGDARPRRVLREGCHRGGGVERGAGGHGGVAHRRRRAERGGLRGGGAGDEDRDAHPHRQPTRGGRRPGGQRRCRPPPLRRPGGVGGLRDVHQRRRGGTGRATTWAGRSPPGWSSPPMR